MAGKGKSRRSPNGTGSVRRRADGRWEAMVSLPDGRRPSVYATTEAEVVAKMQILLNDARLGLPVITKDQTLAAYLADWLENTIKPTRAPATHKNYRQMITLYIEPSLGKIKLTRLTGQDIQRFENELRKKRVARTGELVSERLVQLCHGVLRAALNKAVKFSLIHRNPTLSVDPPKVRRKEVRPLTPEQARRLLQAVRSTRMEAFFTVAVSLGVRPSEALGLRWSDVNLEQGIITVRQQLSQNHDGKLTLRNLKTERSRRVIHLPSVTVRALQEHRLRQKEERLRAREWEDMDLVFCTEGSREGTVGGRPLQHRNVFRTLQRELEMADLPHQRLYDLRHLAASLLLAQGASMREIMEVLGHSQMSLTADTYSHVYDAAGRANADRMDKVLLEGSSNT